MTHRTSRAVRLGPTAAVGATALVALVVGGCSAGGAGTPVDQPDQNYVAGDQGHHRAGSGARRPDRPERPHPHRRHPGSRGPARIRWSWSTCGMSAVSVFGNGGMNTDYEGGQIPAASACASFNPKPGPYNLMCGNGRLGVDLMQLMIAPYASWQVAKGHSIGIAPVIAYQRFKAEGLQAFDNPMLSTSMGSVTNNGYSDSWGGGVRIGYMGEFSKQFSVGAAYATQDQHGRIRRLQGPLRAKRQLRHPVQLHPGRGRATHRAMADRGGLRAHLLQRLEVGEQPELADPQLRRRRRARPASAAATARASAGRTSTSGSSASSTR